MNPEQPRGPIEMQLRVRTRLRTGDFSTWLNANQCYAARNGRSFTCEGTFWNQKRLIEDAGGKRFNPCWGNWSEVTLMECLNKSGETGWYNNFGCTSASQCLTDAKARHKKMTGEEYALDPA